MRLFILFFLIGFFFTANAQTDTNQTEYSTAEDSDPKAIELIESIKETFEAHEAHRFDYSLDIEYPGHEGQKMSGFLIQSGEKFVLDMDSRKIISDNESVWVYLKERNVVEINDADFDEEEGLMKPSDLFKLYNSGKYVFALSYVGQEKGITINQIECKPLEEDSEYSKLRITLNEKDNTIQRIKIFFKDASRMTMNITDYVAGYDTSSNTFAFNKADYEGVIVEDLRF